HDEHGRRLASRRHGMEAHEARVGDHGAPRLAHGPKPQDGLDGEAEEDLLGDVVRDVGHGAAGGGAPPPLGQGLVVAATFPLILHIT
uniref:Uncharacterized protein n=1 Tax=Oryza brachyantha TaxID=4533 RepID=J3MBM6_ORYBR